MNAATQAATKVLAPVIAAATRSAVSGTAGMETDEVQAAVVKEVTAVVVNQTNQEPWFQSRVTIGAIMTLIGGTYALGLDFTDGTMPTVDALTAQLGSIIGAATVLYGRWFATKPLGQ